MSFVQLPADLLEDDRLSATDKVIFCAIKSYAWDDDGECWASLAHIGQRAGLRDPRAIRRAIGHLTARGYVTAKSRPAGKTVHYTIRDYPGQKRMGSDATPDKDALGTLDKNARGGAFKGLTLGTNEPTPDKNVGGGGTRTQGVPRTKTHLEVDTSEVDTRVDTEEKERVRSLSSEEIETLWRDVGDRLPHLSLEERETWITPLRPLAVEGDTLTLLAPDIRWETLPFRIRADLLLALSLAGFAYGRPLLSPRFVTEETHG